MLKTRQFYALVFIFLGSAQSGLLVIGNATKVLNETAKSLPFFAANAWLLASFGGFVNAMGRVGTGYYSDRIYLVSRISVERALYPPYAFSATPYVMGAHNVALLFVVVGVAYWQYGGGLALLPSFTADISFGPKSPWFQLRPGVYWMGCRVFCAPTGRIYQGYLRQPRYGFLPFRHDPHRRRHCQPTSSGGRFRRGKSRLIKERLGILSPLKETVGQGDGETGRQTGETEFISCSYLS